MPDDDTRSQRERMLAGDLYIADDPELAREALRAATLSKAFNDSAPDDAAGRRRILDELLGSIGEGSEIRPPFYCDYGSHTHVGAGTFANFGLVALDVAPITIGDDVQIGPYVQLLTPTHPLDPDARRAKWEAAEPIAIGDNVWLGGGVIVCPGVTIGADTVVGAGAVVTRDLPAGVARRRDAGARRPLARVRRWRAVPADHHTEYLAKTVAALTPEGRRRVDELLEQLAAAAGGREWLVRFAAVREAEADGGHLGDPGEVEPADMIAEPDLDALLRGFMTIRDQEPRDDVADWANAVIALLEDEIRR